MDANKIMNASLDDIIFEGRNKSYGAYWLRQMYARHIGRAGLITISAIILLLLYPYLKILFSNPVDETKPTSTLTELSAPPPLDRNTPPPPPPNLPPPPPKTIKFTPPVIKPDEQVPPDQEPPPQVELQQTDPAPQNTDANTNYDFNNVQQAPVEDKKPEIFMYVEQMPEFPGGNEALLKYLGKNIKYPPAARENGIEGKVVLQFVVDETGNISAIQIIRDIGGGCAEEAIRVVKSMPPWKPGKQNGNAVKVYFKLPVTFKLAAE